MSEHPSNLPSLLDDDPSSPPPTPPKPRGPSLASRTKAALRTPAGRRVGTAVLALVIATGATAAYFTLRPTPQPDYLNDNLDDLFDYTLLTDEFNRLPVEERLALIQQLIERLRSMQGGESTMLAAFAAGIAGAARDQLEENISRLAMDSFDILAVEYDTTRSPEDRTRQAEQSFIAIQSFFEDIAGIDRDMTDEERLAEGRAQAQRDLDALREGEFTSTEAGRLFEFMNEVVGKHATPHQRARATVLLRDMIRVMRSQDVSSGRPEGP